MKGKTATQITIRTLQRTTLRRRGAEQRSWCALCCSDAIMLSPNEAAVVFATTARQIFRLAEVGAIHFMETRTGGLLVCGNSLAARIK